MLKVENINPENKDMNCEHICPYTYNPICCWVCSIGNQCEASCKLNPSDCDKSIKGNKEVHNG